MQGGQHYSHSVLALVHIVYSQCFAGYFIIKNIFLKTVCNLCILGGLILT